MPARSWSREERFRRRMLLSFKSTERRFRWRETTDPYSVLIGEVLLQRTRAENVVDVYRAFIARWPDAEELSTATEEQVERVIRPLGLRKRSVQLVRLGASLKGKHVPLVPEELARLPGVGPYASHSVPIFAAGQTLPLIDWVIARVMRRYFGLPDSKRPNADQRLWDLARELARPGRARELWLGTLDFAASTCRPKPKCSQCSLRNTCEYGIGLAAT